LLESTLDFQFTAFTTFLNDGGKLPKRSSFHNAHAYLDAPYGIYETADGYIALAICSLHRLGEWLECPELASYPDAQSVREKRDEIKAIIAKRLAQRTTADWLARLEPAGIWCAEVLDWDRLVNHEGFKVLDMVQQIKRKHGHTMLTTRCPIRIDGNIYKSAKGSPRVGEHTGQILKEVRSNGHERDS
jgi:Predicted acyl-CoA transferases/carnitine dehydratase